MDHKTTFATAKKRLPQVLAVIPAVFGAEAIPYQCKNHRMVEVWEDPRVVSDVILS